MNGHPPWESRKQLLSYLRLEGRDFKKANEGGRRRNSDAGIGKIAANPLTANHDLPLSRSGSGVEHAPMWIVTFISCQRNHEQVGRFARREAAGFVGPSEGLGAREGGHIQQTVAGEVGVKPMQEAGLGKHIEVGV